MVSYSENVKVKKILNKRKLCFVLVILATLICSIIIGLSIVKLIVAIQMVLFNKPDTLLIVSNNMIFGMCIVFLLLYPIFEILSIFTIARYDSILSSAGFIVGEGFNNKKNNFKLFPIILILILVFALTICLSYGGVTQKGLYYRGISTIFQEKSCSWKDVKSIEIYSNEAEVGYDFKYLIKWDGKSLDLMESYTDRENFNSKLKSVHKLAKMNNVRIEKDIRKISSSDKKLLDYIEPDVDE
jgi:hypothetical protein